MLINVIDKISYVIYLLCNNVLLECRHLQGLLVVKNAQENDKSLVPILMD